MARVLHDLGKRLDLLQLVVARLLHQAFDGQGPLVEIDVGIDDVVVVVRELFEGSDFVVAEGLRQAMMSEHTSPPAQSLK